MKIKLTDGTLISVDDNWRDLVAKYFIGASNPKAFYLKLDKNGYVQVQLGKEVRMLHRALLNHYGKELVDHIDGNILNNKINNLRLCTKQQNRCNSKKPVTNTSGYKGVILSKHSTYIASITYKNKTHYLGSYKTAVAAAKAYDKKALELFGEFAKTNAMLGLIEESL